MGTTDPPLDNEGSGIDHDENAGLMSVDVGRIHDVLPAPLGGNVES